MPNLTDRFVAATKCAAGEKQTDIHDDQVRGLLLRVYATGRRSWILKYTRPSTGKQTKITLGQYPEVSLASARRMAIGRKAEIGLGRDPVAEKRAAHSAMRMSDLVETYVERRAKGLRSGAEIKRRLERNIVAEIGDVKLADLHRRDIARAIDKILERGKRTEANRVFEDARAMVRWAVDKGYLDASPVEGMKRPAKTEVRERVLSADEIRMLLERLPTAKMTSATADIIRLCLITAQRVGEVAGLRRDELDLQNRLWKLPGDRTKNGRPHEVPLSANAMGVISEALERAGESPFLFPSRTGSTSIAGHAVATAIARSQEHIGIAHWTAHDLRRTALTEMEGLGTDPLTLGHVANHVSTTRATVTTRVYGRYSYEKEKRAALDAWGARLDGVIAGGAAIVPLRA